MSASDTRPPRTADESVRVFIVDDHPLVRQAFRDVLNEPDMEVVGEAASLEEARAGIAEHRPDVLLLDLLLPDGHGLDLCRELRGEAPAVLIVTSSPDPAEVVEAVEAGASGYLLKSVDVDDYVHAVRDVAKGLSVVDPAVMGHLLERLRSPSTAERFGSLTAQERRILEHLSEGLTNREIANRIQTTEKTVKNHMSTILRKLGLENRTQAALLMAEHRPRTNRSETGASESP